MADDLLDSFLSVANELTKESGPKRQLRETDIFGKDNNNEDNPDTKNTLGNKKQSSTIHGGDTDSSDDEDNKYYEERKYNESGRELKHLLDSSPSTTSNISRGSAATWKSKQITEGLGSKEKLVPLKKQDVYTDPLFGLRIVNPLVSFTTLQDRMVGREAVDFAKIKTFVSGNISDKNWVIAGVIASKSSVKTSQKGNQFLIWSLSDLKNDIKTVGVFLFGSAYKQLWKTATGTVVGILNPSVLDKKDGSKDEATLSVDNAQKVMILGQSKDLGTCRSMKKNGDPCTAIVNINRCEYCVYHIKQEYQKCSKRSELQANFTGKGLIALRNKVLGKNEVFYAGKLYTSIPAKQSKKLQQKDKNRLSALSSKSFGDAVTPRNLPKKKVSKVATNVEITHHQRLRDLTLLDKLGGGKSDFKATHSAEVTLESSKQVAMEVIAKLKANKNETELNKKTDLKPSSNNQLTKNVPLLLSGKTGTIDLGVGATPQQINRAKLNALKYIQKNGQLKKTNPNSVKTSDSSKKRVLENAENIGNDSKKQKMTENMVLSDRFKKLMEATSKHVDLLDDRDNEEQEKYFHKLEAKERMEEKMVNTFKVPCKAVRCLQCKYTNFSASQFCKENKHPLRVFDAVKRFFKCGNCGNRTQSLEIVPTTSCNNCGSGKWERTGMMKEKKAEVAHKLSIRGGEQTFINSVVTDGNLDLLMPDE